MRNPGVVRMLQLAGPARLTPLVGALCVVFSCDARAQTTRIDRNHSFELPSAGDQARPWGWGYAWGRTSFVRDSTHAYAGDWSLRSHSTATVRGAFTNWVELLSTGENGLRVSAWIRTEILDDGYAGLGVMYAGPAGPFADTLAHPRVSGSRQWTYVTYDARIPAGVRWIQPMGHVRGSGTAWFDDVRIEVNGKPLPDWTLPPAPSPADIAALRPYMIRLLGIDAGTGFEDLRALRPLFSSARVVALGEANHGSGPFVRVKHRLLEFAVRELGFSYFAMEDNQGSVRLVNDYVLTGQGNLDSLMRPLFSVSRTRELRALIEWMRSHNASGGPLIELIGVDMQEPTIPIDSVLAFIGRRDPVYLKAARSMYADMRSAWQASRYPQRPDSIYDEWLRNSRSVLNHLKSKQATYLRRASTHDSSELAWAIQSANVTLQSAMMMRRTSPAVRDSSMAANLVWHLARKPGARAILSGHNGHIWTKPGAIGSYLRRSLGATYRPIGFTAFAGSYRARDIVSGHWRETAHFPALPGSVEHALHGLGVPNFIVDLRSAAVTPQLKWLFEERPFRSTGTEGVDYDFGDVAIAAWVDAVLSVERDEPTVPLGLK